MKGFITGTTIYKKCVYNIKECYSLYYYFNNEIVAFVCIANITLKLLLYKFLFVF